MLLHGYLAVGLPRPAAALVTEFQPFDGRAVAAGGFLALLVWRASRGRGTEAPWRDPAVVIAVGSWALAFVAARFWADWAVPAVLAVAAMEFQEALERRPVASAPRAAYATAAGVAVLLLLVTGSDLQRRWSDQVGRPFLSRENPSHAPWLPEPGGIVYSAEMGVFYAIYFKNRTPPVKYRFEPAIMPNELCRVLESNTKGVTEPTCPGSAACAPKTGSTCSRVRTSRRPSPGSSGSSPCT
jgi:hypothetical protein